MLLTTIRIFDIQWENKEKLLVLRGVKYSPIEIPNPSPSKAIIDDPNIIIPD
jgi:hypothetical protein